MMRKATTVAACVAALVLAVVGCKPTAVDNQSDNGSSVIRMGGNGNHELPDGSSLAGTYKTRATTPTQQKRCRWRVYAAVGGKWRQISPGKRGAWNRPSALFHRGSVHLSGHVLFQTRECPAWERRK